MTFSPTPWAAAGLVKVAGKEDDDNDAAVSLAHTVTSGDVDYAELTIDAVAVSVPDNDNPGLAVSVATVGENASGTYTVELNSQPKGPVTITSSAGGADVYGGDVPSGIDGRAERAGDGHGEQHERLDQLGADSVDIRCEQLHGDAGGDGEPRGEWLSRSHEWAGSLGYRY